MSGLAGIIYFNGRETTDGILEKMAASTPHLGADGICYWRDGAAGFVRFKNATTPEAVGETQPFRNSGSGNAIVFDGRLDNRSELLARLADTLPPSAPDCEIALALHEKFGDGFLSALTGDYAFAIWSPGRRRLFCARSPMGWRTFQWTITDGFFAFASQPRTLIEGLGLPRRLDEGTIGEDLSTRFVTTTGTFWKDLHRLPGGAALALEDGRVRTWHWHTADFPDFSRRSEADHVEEFRALFDQSLIATTRSSTDVASLLSGGLDSSTVVCRGTELYRAGQIARPIRAMTARYPGEPQDETAWSAEVERHLGIEAGVVGDTPYDFDEAAQWCRDTLHLPMRPNPLKPVAHLLKDEGVRVLLTGEGGDDWTAGTYAHWPDLILAGRWVQLYREAVVFRHAASLYHRWRNVGSIAVYPLVSPKRRAALRHPYVRFGTEPPAWINPDWAKKTGLAERWRSNSFPVTLKNYAQDNRYYTFALPRRHINWDNALAFLDTQNIEVRHPFHDLKLSHFLMGAAGEFLRRGDLKKHLLREAMRGTLPEKIRARRDKANFTKLLVTAAERRFRERDPSKLLPVQMGWVDGDYVRRLHAEHAAWWNAGRPQPALKTQYNLVWTVIALDLWLEHAFKV